MEIDKHEKLYNAMEMLELMLPKKYQKTLTSSLISSPIPNNISRKIHQEVEPFFDKVIFETPRIYNPWTRSVYLLFVETNQSDCSKN